MEQKINRAFEKRAINAMTVEQFFSINGVWATFSQAKQFGISIRLSIQYYSSVVVLLVNNAFS